MHDHIKSCWSTRELAEQAIANYIQPNQMNGPRAQQKDAYTILEIEMNNSRD